MISREVIEIGVVGKVYVVLLQVCIKKYLLQRLILSGKAAALLVVGQKIMYLLFPTDSTELSLLLLLLLLFIYFSLALQQ